MLQTENYIRAMLSRSATIPANEVEVLVHARITRQDILNRSRRPIFTYYLHESVLKLPVGSSAVMSDQLHHLLRLSVRSGLELRVIPCEIGAHAGMAGSFTLMEFDDFDPIVYLESEAADSHPGDRAVRQRRGPE